MRVLWLSDETPDVDGQGGQRRQFFQIKVLRDAGHEITVVTVMGAQSDDNVSRLATVHRIRTRIGPLRNPFTARETRNSLAGEWDRIVVAHSESWVRWGAVAGRLEAPILVDMHNVLSAWHQQRGELDSARYWRSVETDIAARATISVCSPKEAERLRPISEAAVILPHGVEPFEWTRPPIRSAVPKLKLFGNWYWQPNQDGLAWFTERVWQDLPEELSCEVAGQGAESMAMPRGVQTIGRVSSVPEFLADAHLVAVPVRGGVGAPVKYLEALTSGVPTLATTDAAAFAAPFRTFTSDSPEDWINYIRDALDRPSEPAQEALEIREWVLHEMHWANSTKPLLAWLEGTP